MSTKISLAEFKTMHGLVKIQAVVTTAGKKRILCFPEKGDMYDIPAARDLSMNDAPSFILTDDNNWIAVNTAIQIQKKGLEF